MNASVTDLRAIGRGVLVDTLANKASAAAPMLPGRPEMGILSRTRRAPPTFPLDVLGPWWRDWVAQAAEGANAPPDYVALPLLAAASALIGNARWARAWQSWIEPPVLWCAGIGNPSSGKTPGAAPVMREALGIVEKHMRSDFPAELAAWNEAKQVADAIGAQWEKDVATAVKKGGQIPAKPAEATPGPAPVRPRVRVNDANTEAVATLMEALPKGVMLTRDELAGWLLNLNRYTAGTDRPFWLEAYAGGAYTVDRRGRPDPLFIRRLAIPTYGTMQPDKLAEVLGAADDGLAGRFLWAWPEPGTFRKPGQGADTQGAATALIRLADLAMVQDADGERGPSFLSLTDDAAAGLETFCLEMQGREEASQGLFKSTLGKARGQAVRLSLVLTFLRWCVEGGAEPTRIMEAELEAACALMRDYFLPMAERVLGDASIPAEERNARTLAGWIMQTHPATVNVSNVRDRARLPGLRETEAVKAACRFLADAGWLSPADTPTGGRPRGDWTVNPALWAPAA